MPVRPLSVAVMMSALVIAAACGGSARSAHTASDPAIRLSNPQDDGAAFIEVTGLTGEALAALRETPLTADQWSGILRVAVDDKAAGMLGTYSVADSSLRFTPMYPLDPGRQYWVRFDPAKLPGGSDGGGANAPAVIASVGLPAPDKTPSTVVARVYPTSDVVPENLLRMYIEFSGPMARPSGIQHMKLLDDSGEEIPGAFLPLDYEFWSPDHTRFTAFFDPGRVKRGILPNQQMGRPLGSWRSVTLVVSREWRDQHGLPLKEEFRRVLRVGPANERPLDTASWHVQPPPAAAGRDGLVVTFPEPLDHGLLMRALGVTRGGVPLDGDIIVDHAETRWTFTPREPWRPGAYHLLALDILEDVAGNQIGRAFEVDNFDTVDKSPDPKSITIPFSVGVARTN